ncbi:MAG: hypothetical protein IV100_32115 [Myxococcales bacterium]|nr:hypothetical protein [Myxococcales bacterium]
MPGLPARYAIADPDAGRVFEFDGDRLTVLAGTGEACSERCCEDHEDATATPLGYPSDVLALPDGRLLIANARAGCVLVLSTSGALAPFAGRGGLGGSTGDGGPAASATLDDPEVVVAWLGRGFLIAEAGGCRVRRVDEGGVISTVAGTGRCGYGGDGGPATRAMLSAPAGLAVTASGDGFFIADTDNGRVRLVDAAGIISTVAGTGGRGTRGDGGVATRAELNEPEGLLVQGETLWIADTDNSLIRRLEVGRLATVPLIAADGRPLRMRYPKAIIRAAMAEGVQLLIADTDHGRLISAPVDGRGARVWFGGEGVEEHDPAGLPTAERERRAEVMKSTASPARAEQFRVLTDDLELDDSDRALRWETLGPDPQLGFEALLKRARVR